MRAQVFMMYRKLGCNGKIWLPATADVFALTPPDCFFKRPTWKICGGKVTTRWREKEGKNKTNTTTTSINHSPLDSIFLGAFSNSSSLSQASSFSACSSAGGWSLSQGWRGNTSWKQAQSHWHWQTSQIGKVQGNIQSQGSHKTGVNKTASLIKSK